VIVYESNNKKTGCAADAAIMSPISHRAVSKIKTGWKEAG